MATTLPVIGVDTFSLMRSSAYKELYFPRKILKPEVDVKTYYYYYCRCCCCRWWHLLLGLLVLRPSISSLLQSAIGITKYDNFITKCDSFFITKCDKCYYKARQVLQSVRILLQSAAGITKCNDYYKVRQRNRQLYIMHGQYQMFLLFYFCLFNFLVFTARRFWVCFTWNHRWLFAVWTGRYTWYGIFVLHFFLSCCLEPSFGLANHATTITRNTASLLSITFINHFLLISLCLVTCLVPCNQLLKV